MSSMTKTRANTASSGNPRASCFRAFAVVQLLLLGLSTSSSGQNAHTPYNTGLPYNVGPNVQVSASQATIRHYETYVAADRKNAGHLVAGAIALRPGNQTDNVFYVSFDGGATWSHTLTVPVAVDPSCAIGLGGVAFAASVHDLPDEKGTPVLSVYRSSDGGRTWKPSSISGDIPPIDRPYLTVDDTDSAFKNHVYVHAYRYSRKPAADVLFCPGANEGRSFENILVNHATTFEKPWFFPANGVVGNDGTFFALVAELDDSKRNMSYRTDAASAPSAVNGVLNIFVSQDGGKTLSLAGKIGDAYYDWRVPQLSMPALAVDRSRGRFRDRLYAVWPDARYDHRTQILFSSSIDKGHTWTPAAVIDNDANGSQVNGRANNFMPVVAVNRSGVVGVSWYDRRDNPDNLGYHVRFRASVDGGRTWLPSVRVSTTAHVADDDARKNSGDTAGLAADADGVFHPVWIDNRTGIPQMWTTTVKVRTKGPSR
jgi:hypothetical protein